MFEHLLVPLDGSDFAERALAYAEQLAATTGARITLLSVLLRPQSAEAPHVDKLDDQSRERLQAELAAVASKVSARLVTANVDTAVLVGEPAGQIADFADSHGVDLIVMSTHGLGATGRYALGSVALKVLMTAPCPVFMVRIPTGAAAEQPQRP